LAHTAAHESIQKTLHRLRTEFFIDHDRRVIYDFVLACATCQRNKTENLHPAGFLQPLPVPSRVWADITMDFLEALPKVHGKSVILTVVDRFSKYTHFIPLGHPYTATSVARAFFHDIVRLHGFPDSIISDRDPVFTGRVWRDLFRQAGVQLRMSTAFHPQTMVSRRWSTKRLPCTTVVSAATALATSLTGCRGLNFATTPPTTRRTVLRRSRWSTVALHRSC
jgi:hypothetical protein